MKRVPKAPALILLVLITAALFADFLALGNPEFGNPRQRLLPPCWETRGTLQFPLGTDTMGRDILTRLIYGARITLLVSFGAVIFAGFLGTAAGVVAGFFGGWVDQVIMRFTDAWLSIPVVMFGMLMGVIVGSGVFNIVIILSLVFWTRYARVVRGETLEPQDERFCPSRHHRRMREIQDYEKTHSTQCHEQCHYTGVPANWDCHCHGSFSDLPGRRGTPTQTGLGTDAVGGERQGYRPVTGGWSCFQEGRLHFW